MASYKSDIGLLLCVAVPVSRSRLATLKWSPRICAEILKRWVPRPVRAKLSNLGQRVLCFLQPGSFLLEQLTQLVERNKAINLLLQTA